MKIVGLDGGLGNQICQYVFSRYLDIIYGYENVLIDNLYFCGNQMHNGYELDLFPNIKLNLLSNMFDSDVWDNMIDIYRSSRSKCAVPYIFYNNGIEVLLLLDEYCHDGKGHMNNTMKFKGTYCTLMAEKFHNKFQNEKQALHDGIKKYDNVYYKGVWFTDLYCNDIKEYIVHELKFPPLIHQENIDYCESICSSEISVGLHIRLGDFIDCNKTVSNSKYSKNVINIKRKLENTNQSKPNFFIFSDDITWCKENTKKLGLKDQDSVTFIEGNSVDARNYIDMQLMTYCDYLIHNHQSSFCLAAQMISTKNITRIPVK